MGQLPLRVRQLPAEGDPPSVLAHHFKSFTPSGSPVPYGGKPAFRTGLTCTHNGFAPFGDSRGVSHRAFPKGSKVSFSPWETLSPAGTLRERERQCYWSALIKDTGLTQ
jgi:hypothetical protein